MATLQTEQHSSCQHSTGHTKHLPPPPPPTHTQRRHHSAAACPNQKPSRDIINSTGFVRKTRRGGTVDADVEEKWQSGGQVAEHGVALHAHRAARRRARVARCTQEVGVTGCQVRRVPYQAVANIVARIGDTRGDERRHAADKLVVRQVQVSAGLKQQIKPR